MFTVLTKVSQASCAGSESSKCLSTGSSSAIAPHTVACCACVCVYVPGLLLPTPVVQCLPHCTPDKACEMFGEDGLQLSLLPGPGQVAVVKMLGSAIGMGPSQAGQNLATVLRQPGVLRGIAGACRSVSQLVRACTAVAVCHVHWALCLGAFVVPRGIAAPYASAAAMVYCLACCKQSGNTPSSCRTL